MGGTGGVGGGLEGEGGGRMWTLVFLEKRFPLGSKRKRGNKSRGPMCDKKQKRTFLKGKEQEGGTVLPGGALLKLSGYTLGGKKEKGLQEPSSVSI